MSSPGSLLSVGTRFELNRRIGAVIEQRRNGVIVLWEEFVDPQSGEVFAPIAESLEASVISDADIRGMLRILHRPSMVVEKSERPLFLRSDKELARQKWRLCHVQAAALLIEQGLLKPTRASFIENALLLLSKGDQIYREMLLHKAQGEKKRGGAAVTIGQQHCPPSSAAQVHKWYLSFKREGPGGLFDRYSRSGNRSDRYSPAIMSIVRGVINTRLDEERCTVSSIVDSVQAACLLHYERHGSRGSLKMPGYEFIHDLIDALAPIDHQIRRRGFAVAYKDMHSLGVGITTSRAFERVEIDEHSLDLMVILQGFGIWDWLTEEEREQLNLNGTASRVTVSAAIDVHTRCIVAMRMSAGSTTSLARETIEMLVQDKTPVADAVGAHDPWDMYGRPEKIVFDRGATYLADELYDLLSELGIGYLGAPARKPWLRPFIERLFRTVHNGLVQRFSGRTFSNVVAKGENDAQARASLTLPELLQWLVRWIVDVYHNTPHGGLGRRTPAEAWAQAVAVHRPELLTRDELRRAFGIRRRVKLGSKGLRVMHIDYQTVELAEFCNRFGRGKEFDVFWWPADIGVILVKISEDQWMSVSAADKKWIGKSFEDLLRLRHYTAGDRAVSDLVRAKAIKELDAAAHDGKVRRGLLPTILDAENFEYYEGKFLRFMVTADQELAETEQRDLFEDEVSAPAFSLPLSDETDEDLME